MVEGWVTLKADSVGKTAAAIRAHVDAAGGRVVAEDLSGGPIDAAYGTMQLRLPPAEAQAFLDWIEKQGEIEARRIQGTDVSKTLFDQALALKNLSITMDRLQALLQKEGLAMADILAIETQMTRLRGEMERIAGERRWLTDRVAFATFQVTLRRKGGPAVFAPEAKLHPGPRFTVLSLVDPVGRKRTRMGGGLSLHFSRALTLDLDVFPEEAGEGRTLITTMGGSTYSDFLGRGHRSFGNPYLGLRLGYGWLSDQGRFVVAGDLGLELYKQKYLLVDLGFRVVSFIDGDGADVALQGALGVNFPF